MESTKFIAYYEKLLQQCKQEAKQLLETTATTKKVHWTHPSYISFCLSVDNILSYGVRRRYTSTPTVRHPLTSSGRVLQELGKIFPVARSIYQMCYGDNKSKVMPEYARFHSDTVSEQRILWIRTAMIEKTMKPIIDELLKRPELYYNKHSIMCHPVYSELFASLMDGPCSLSISRMKTIDSSVLSPGPTELVSRHKVIPNTDSLVVQETPSAEMWQHVQSLYKSSMASCLYGKNNILMTPPGVKAPLQGYLTLIQLEETLFIKWLPNTLINGTSLEWVHVLSVDVTHDVAHLHCHQGPEQDDAVLILIGYNGIAYPSLTFPQPSSMLSFLDALENGLHPQGCLEPPLWFLRQQQINTIPRSTSISSTIKNIAVHGTPIYPITDSDMWGFPPVWNQVFRVRFTKQPHNEEPEWMENELNTGATPHQRVSSPSMSFSSFNNGTSSQSVSVAIGNQLSGQFVQPNVATPTKESSLPLRQNQVSLKKQNSRKYLLEKFQTKVSSQLLARYFYSWLSYCRHIARVKTSLSHLILTQSLPPSPLPGDFEITYHTFERLDETLWQEYLLKRDEQTWIKVLQAVYNGGIDSHLRPQVWPYLLGVFPSLSTPAELEAILKDQKHVYRNTLKKWRTLERQHYHNNDPTATSLAIRLGLTANGHTTEHAQTDNDTHDPIPDLIVLEDEIQSHDDHMVSSEEENDSGCEDTPILSDRPRTSGSSDGGELRPHPPNRDPSEERTDHSEGEELSKRERLFLDELFKIDKDIPRCDRDYQFFKVPQNLTKLRNIITSYIWQNLSNGYSQGMCDLLAPLLVVFENEELAFACFTNLMSTMEYCFPPKPGVSQRMANLQSLLQILENDFFQYLNDQPMGDALFYTYRWFLVNFKREFCYNDIFHLWETSWAARHVTTEHFEVFIAFALLLEFKGAIMDAQLDPSEILNLFTELAETKVFNCKKIIAVAQATITDLQGAL